MTSGELFAAARAAGITTIRLGIYQPKCGGMREHVIALEDLEAFAEYARQKENTAHGATKMRGKIPDAEWARIYLNPTPNEDDCAFCKAMAVCPNASAMVEEAVESQVPDIAAFGATEQPVPTEPASLAAKLKATPFIEDWCAAVRAEAERQMLAGGTVPGFGLELGRQGPRKWADPLEAEKVIRMQFRVRMEDAYNMKIKSPTQIEKLMEGEKPILGPRQWKNLQQMVTRSEAKPSVKPIGVIKTPYQVKPLDVGAFPETSDSTDLG